MIDTGTNSFSDLDFSVITTGTFDGLHLGHRKVLAETVRIARKNNGIPVVLTFWPHPRTVLGKGEISLINTLEEKKEIFRSMGIEHVYVQEFTKEFSQMTSDDYVKSILVDTLKVKVLVIGYDHQFGKERSGKFETLGDLATLFGFRVERVEAFDIDGLNISSTKIRNALLEGKVSNAATMLGYSYFFSGKVVEGNKIGRMLGFPTANIELNDDAKLLPKDGIYAVHVKFSGKFYKGMLSIGYRPTFPDQPVKRTIEVNIFEFDQEIYGQNLTAYFAERLRDEVKFEDKEALILQMKNDKTESLQLLNDYPLFAEKLV